MIVLGIETATWVGSVGVWADGEERAEVSRRVAHSHGASLLGLIEEALAAGGIAREEVDAVAVSLGPGSFTGLRIGLATAKGLAFAGGTALVGVPTLDALAVTAGARPGEKVCAVLDARKHQLFGAFYRMRSDGRLERLGPDMALAPEELAVQVTAPCVVVGDGLDAYGGALRRLLPAQVRCLPASTHHPRGGAVARLGAERLRCGDVDDPGRLEPIYARASDAELARQHRSASSRVESR